MMEEHQRNVDTCVRDNQLPQESIQIGCYGTTNLYTHPCEEHSLLSCDHTLYIPSMLFSDHQVPPFPSHDHDHSNNSTSVLDSSSVSSTVPLSREDFKRKVWKNKQILQDQVRQRLHFTPFCLSCCYYKHQFICCYISHNLCTGLLEANYQRNACY